MYPRGGLSFSTLWGRGMEFDFGEWTVNFRDYPIPYLLTKDMHFFGIVVGAEEFEEGGRSLRECLVPLPQPWETHIIERNMSPLKFYYDMQCESAEYSATYGPCWEPCLSMVSLMWNNISAPSRDPSIPLPFWDKMRFLLHGRFSWLSSKTLTTPPRQWRYAGTNLAWTGCSDHDSYRAFRSSSLDLSLTFDVAAGAGNGDTGDRLPHVLLYANTFRCLEFLINTLTMKNRNVRKGCLFGTSSYPKPQLGKHFGKVNVSLNFPKFYITYWMSHSSDYGFRVISDGLNLMAAMKLSVQAASEQGITRRRSYVWTPQHVSATLWGTKVRGLLLRASLVHVYSQGHAPSVDGTSNDEATFLLGVSRVSYIRENSQGHDSSQHRLTVHDLKVVDLLNSQVVLKGCERAGFILITAARASVTQKVHRCVWRNGQLLGKKSWSAIISGMQYFAPISNPDGKEMKPFRWLTKEVIEEKAPTGAVGDPYLHPYIGAGDAVGGVVDAKETSEELQLQRIVSRCSCEIYFCYFSEELKTDAIEETGVPKYEMVVDIVNNLVLFVDPKKKELAERRRKLRFACQMTDMKEMRERIIEQQVSDV
ncbi:hypothetical protein ANCCEY_02119 [Ancylostoma ceylanicum]|uniref:FMP27/BLTP2/Hobbit GFWDK motif-containing RBG unit domain-containing protein n=1 Tax=Ancylostoma ceylanicum TaxID=53326 RepID=A0A0D6M3L6_9BILA|nr:hypothetical protein ANCCEY_02119 [Ancylostoma ceylanicum]